MDKFKQVIRDMIKLFEENYPMEQAKLKAIQEDNVAVVEECMNKEQAVTLKLRGLDQKRERIQKELGWEGKTFREIIPLAPENHRQELQELLDRLDAVMTVFQETNRSAMDVMAVHLRDIQKVIKIKDPEGQYNQEGNPLQKDKPLTSRRV